MTKRTVLSLAAALAIAVPCFADVVDYTTLPDGCSASQTLGGTTVTGSSSVCSGSVAGIRGLGIQGGGNNATLDLGETLSINYGGLVHSVFLKIWDVDPPGNVTFSFTAFNGASDLGTFAIPNLAVNPTNFNLDALDGNLSLTSIRLQLSASPPLGLQIQGTSFAAAVPEPGSLGLLLSIVIGCCVFKFRPALRKGA